MDIKWRGTKQYRLDSQSPGIQAAEVPHSLGIPMQQWLESVSLPQEISSPVSIFSFCICSDSLGPESQLRSFYVMFCYYQAPK